MVLHFNHTSIALDINIYSSSNNNSSVNKTSIISPHYRYWKTFSLSISLSLTHSLSLSNSLSLSLSFSSFLSPFHFLLSRCLFHILFLQHPSLFNFTYFPLYSNLRHTRPRGKQQAIKWQAFGKRLERSSAPPGLGYCCCKN